MALLLLLLFVVRYLSWYSDGLRAGRSRFDSWKGKIFLFTLQRPNRLLAPTSLQPNGYRLAFSQGVKHMGREADHSLSSSAEVKMVDTPPYAFMA
jgi:hypothetical protein